MGNMRFGLITPVFDGCIESLELLYSNIAEQTHENWIWVLCANKFSEKMASFVRSKRELDRRCRIVYLTTNLKDEKNIFSIIANIGKRRNICIKRTDVDYFFMMNADSKIIDRDMLSKINEELENNPKNLCIYKIILERGVIYPRFPISKGKIDSLNYCVSANTARKVGYPNNADFRTYNDVRFFARVFKECGGDYAFINEIFCEFNGNKRYRNVITIRGQNSRLTLQFLNYISYCLHENYLRGLIVVLKEILVAAGISPRLLFGDRTN